MFEPIAHSRSLCGSILEYANTLTGWGQGLLPYDLCSSGLVDGILVDRITSLALVAISGSAMYKGDRAFAKDDYLCGLLYTSISVFAFGAFVLMPQTALLSELGFSELTHLISCHHAPTRGEAPACEGRRSDV